MHNSSGDRLRTVGEISEFIGQPFWRIRYAVATSPSIQPVQRVRNYRLFDHAAVREIMKRIESMDAKRPV